MNTIKELRSILDQRKGKRQQIEQNIERIKTELKTQRHSLRRHEQAREIIREVGLKTQEQLQFHISDITSLAMEAVFPDPYTLKVEFVQRRNKTECDLLFERNGNICDPLEASGGGAVDIAAFALRIASWSMQLPHTRNTIILDEPLKWVSAEYQEAASQMIKEISKRLNLQFIIVTHNPILTSYADKVFQVSIKDGISQVQ